MGKGERGEGSGRFTTLGALDPNGGGGTAHQREEE